MPAYVRKAALWALLRATAQAFGCPVPSLAGLSPRECLERYAEFTRSQAAALLQVGGDVPAVQERLYRNAFKLGRTCKRLCRIRNAPDGLALSRVLYRLLEIEFAGDEESVVISHCYFSRFYTGQICQVMSAMDRGLIAGLTGGRQLEFCARITEGAPRCQAYLNVQKDESR